MIKAAIFDMDGLLIDSEPMHFAAWKSVYENHGLTLTEDEYPQFVGTGDITVGIYAASRFKLAINPENLVEEKKRIYLDLIKGIKFVEGAVPLIKSFRSNKIKTAIATSYWRNIIDSIMKPNGYGELFDLVVCGDDVKEVKPSPEIYILAAKKLAVEPRECIALEDSRSGVLAAKAAGIFCVAIPNMYSKHQNLPADMIRKSLKEVKLEEILNI
ncbi:MAG: HAD family phosphatase [Candidatus Aenigmatarchaeota archaeon]